MIKRPILVAVIGYIIGILWGLYLKNSIVPFYILIFATYYIYIKFNKKRRKNKFKLLSIHRYSRYLKLIINSKIILILVIFSIISNIVILYKNNQYEKTYSDNQDIELTAIIISSRTQKQYYDLYKVKILNSNFNMYIQVGKNVEELEYGDKIQIKGKYIKPSMQRNYKGYDDSKYLKTLKVVGRIKVDKVDVKAKKQLNLLFQFANDINIKIRENIEKIFSDEKAIIIKALLLGDKQDIQEDLKEEFQVLNISHVLAISGMHIGYIVIGLNILLKRLIGKKYTKIVTIIFLIGYTLITGFSPSIIRASIMGVLVISSGLFYRKNDIWNSIGISLFIILIYNPFLILDVGLQLSYLGTISIIIFNSTIQNIFDKIKIKKNLKEFKSIKEILSVTISAQIMILPILISNFNIIGIYSLISNLLVSIIIGLIIVFSFLCIIVSLIYMPIAKLFIVIINLGIEILIAICNFSKLPFSKIYVPTPNILFIIFYFFIVFIGKYIYKIYTLKKTNGTQKRVRNLIELCKYKFNSKKKRNIVCMIIVSIIITGFHFLPQDLKIYFVDVGQGDCTFIVTPTNKTILIDGGGSLSNNYDVGKQTLIPYLLDRGYTRVRLYCYQSF